MSWIRIKPGSAFPVCTVCGKPDWCTVNPQDGKACCMRVESIKPAKNGGWFHPLQVGSVPTKKPVSDQRRPKTVKVEDLCRMVLQCRCDNPVDLAATLGVSVKSLKRLEVGFDGKNWMFPMRNGYNCIVGIRLRTESGRKFAVTGSKNGLFWPTGVNVASREVLFICEGSTDCAALLDMGFEAIGRPSCSGGVEDIKQFLYHADRTVVIMSDKDAPQTSPDGRQFTPGQDGTERLAKEIKSLVRSVKVIEPCKGKDARQWKRAGATKEIVMAVVKNARFV